MRFPLWPNLFLVPLLLFCPLGANAVANAQADEMSRSWNQPVKPYRVIGNIYYVGAAEVTSFLIVTPEGPDPAVHCWEEGLGNLVREADG